MADYYIHPRQGSDQHDGLTPARAWASFAPLARIQLQPGDTVETLAAGPLEHSIHLRGNGTPEAPIRVRLAPGRYDMHPAHMTARHYEISNCNDGRDIPKHLAVFVDHASHIRIEGFGARIVCRGKMIELCIDESQHIDVVGLTFDYHRPTVSEWTVISATDDAAEIAVHADSTYRINDGKVTWVGEGWEYDTGLAQQLIPDTHHVWRRKDPLAHMRIEEIAPNRLRATQLPDAPDPHKMVAGHVFQLRNAFRDCCGAFINHSADVTLDRMRLAFMHGMGVLVQFTHNIALRRVVIEPDPGSGRTTSAWADCTHFSGCRGRVVLQDCVFDGAHDDATNIHGTYLRIIDQPSANQLKVAFIHRQTFGFLAFAPGDEIDYIHAGTLASYASARVTQVEMLNPREQLLTLNQPAVAWRENDVIENVTWTPAVEITGCTVRRIPTRGFLTTTRRPILISDNTLIKLRRGVHVSCDSGSWFESGCVHDMTITCNRFLDCDRSAVCVGPENVEPNDNVHRSIRIEQNRIYLTGDALAVDAKGVTNLTVANNDIITEQGPTDATSRVKLTDCNGATID